MIVYLAGGMRTPWRDEVRNFLTWKDITYLDPCDHHLSDSAQYTIWDLAAIDRCDVLFGYMEPDNPGGQGLALEIGYARARGKIVILADRSDNKYMRIVRTASSVWFDNLYIAIDYLKTLYLVYKE